MSDHHALKVDVAHEAWPLANPFVISRGAKTESKVVVVTVKDSVGHVGRGECVPYARYGETADAVERAIRSWQPTNDRNAIMAALPPGAARNAIDCALWDYEARKSGKAVAGQLDVPPVQSTETAFTLSLNAPDHMAEAATRAKHQRILKLKLGGDDHDAQRMRAVRAARPDARLIGDANEGWTEGNVTPLLTVASELGFEMIEQPLPVGNDHTLADMTRPVCVCADESHHTTEDLADLVSRYDAVNIKLDKTGGLTAAHHAIQAARQLGFDIMIGSMVATSLAVAPAFLLAGAARWVDLDGPLLLKTDRANGFHFRNGQMTPPLSGLWGTAD